MSVSANMAIVTRLWDDIYSNGEVDLVDEVMANEYLNHDLLPGEEPGAEGVRQFVLNLRSAFPDLRFAVEQMVAKDDMVVTRWLATGTHEGDFLAIPASGRRMSATGMTMHRLEDGVIVEGWTNWDALTMLTQIGVLSPPGSG